MEGTSVQIDMIDFIDDELCDILICLLYSVTCQAISLFGFVTNIINIICFIKQGFKDPINISLLGLAVSDLGCLTTLIMINIFVTPGFSGADLPFDAFEFQYLISGWPHIAFSRITSWITALITLERCLCITVPLKVKNLVTPNRTFVIIIIVYITLISAMTPIYVVNRLDWKFFPDRNKTLIGLVVTDDRESVETVSFAINNVFIPNTAFMIIIVSTITLVASLRKHRQWREQSTGRISDGNFNRNQRVAYMVVIIAALFISCFLPFSFIFLGMICEPEFSAHGKYKNTITVLVAGGMILESVNSSTNVFIYYHMSSRYRSAFRQLFCNLDVKLGSKTGIKKDRRK